MAYRERLLANSSSESSLSNDSDSSSDDSECTGSTWRFLPRYTAQEKGKALASEQLSLRPAISVYGASDDENPAGGSPRSVQTAFSLAESIGYSTDFVLGSAEEAQPTEAVSKSEGVTMATLLCWTTVIVLVVAGSCYLVQSIVG
ncbi:g4233 [Coccomyxa viridis]|uniref:G4233 protein n=1 Tax=Coccomyxa viridis TaxID=1274662 RepID=A0ABP1FTU3_9CHLO